MKLLFDQYISPKLVKSLEDIFPDSNHVSPLNLDEANDTKIWEFAKANHFTLVTKDADFSDINILHGFPPKIIWIRRGNCTTSEIEKILRNNVDSIKDLETEKEIGLITLF